jgi:aldehyde dehydrogenase (NAD+)
MDLETQIGPVVSEQQLRRVTDYIAIGQEEGVRTVLGGQRATGTSLDKGYFISPTVFADVENTMRISQEEIFGPVISVMPFDDVDDAIRIANATVFGLGSGVWTKDIGKAHQVAKSLRAGTVWVNCYGAMDVAMPFGGYKMSGYGREGGVEQLDQYLETKAVVLKTA